MPAILVALFDEPGKGDTEYFSLDERVFVLASDIVHRGMIKHDLLMWHDLGHPYLEDGLLHDEKARQFDGTAYEVP